MTGVIIMQSWPSEPDGIEESSPFQPLPPPRRPTDEGMEAYSCLCGSFILVLCTVLVIFVVGIIKASMSEDGYEMGNIVFMALCIAILVMLILTSLSCLCMCQKHYNADADGGRHVPHRNGSSKEGAYYIVGWNMKILKQSGSDCPICWEKMDSKQELKAKLVCQHVFHYHCWDKYAQMASTSHVCCPLCRATPIKFPGMERIKSDMKIFVDRFRCFKRRGEQEEPETQVAMIDV